MIAVSRIAVLALASVLCALGPAACGGGGGDGGGSDGGAHAAPLADGFDLLPDEPELRRHALVADLDRLRRAYRDTGAFEDALTGVWLPDALSGARQPLWKTTFGIALEDVSIFASAGFHPAEIAVARGSFVPSAIGRALTRRGYERREGSYVRGSDGEIDASTAAGRLALASLNRVVPSRARVLAASTSALVRSARSPTASLADRPEFAALAKALDPITAVIVLDAGLVRPPSGVPTRIITRHPARLVGVGLDDGGRAGRTLKIALVYDETADAREDAELIEGELATTVLPGLPGTRFADIASEWDVGDSGPAILITADLPPGESSGVWRDLVERGDLAPFVRPAERIP